MPRIIPARVARSSRAVAVSRFGHELRQTTTDRTAVFRDTEHANIAWLPQVVFQTAHHWAVFFLRPSSCGYRFDLCRSRLLTRVVDNRNRRSRMLHSRRVIAVGIPQIDLTWIDDRLVRDNRCRSFARRIHRQAEIRECENVARENNVRRNSNVTRIGRIGHSQ